MTKPPALSEQELIQECKKGSLKHQETLYKMFFGYAMGIGLRYLPDRDDAIETVNDAFIKVFNSIQSFKNEQNFKPWLRRIVVNTAIDRRRKDLKHAYQVDLEEAHEIGNTAEAIEHMNAQEILGLFNQLSALQRTIFNLYEVDGYNHEEIGKMLNIPSSSSRVNLSRAKERLRAACIQVGII